MGVGGDVYIRVRNYGARRGVVNQKGIRRLRSSSLGGWEEAFAEIESLGAKVFG